MIFSSVFFVFGFVPIFLLAYYASPLRFRSIVLLVFSYIFYAWWSIEYLLLFVFVTLANYFLGVKLDGCGQIFSRWLIVLGVSFNLLVLGFFKYFNFFADGFGGLYKIVSGEDMILYNVVLPIGISFYIFQSISYLIDVYRKDVESCKNIIDFSAFIALFPQLIAGPVLRYKDIERQFIFRNHSFDNFYKGVVIFISGFCFKVLLADSVAPLADKAFENASILTTFDAWIGALSYTSQLYFDFLGYSSMAVGLGLMVGFVFPKNFDHPYLSVSISEFWRRWHISLSAWLKDYLYIPLGGSRYGIVKTYRNLLITMVLGGFWHGASWVFILWGCWHGILLCLEKYLSNKICFRIPVFLSWLSTFLLVVIGWIIFRSNSIDDLVHYLDVFLFFDARGLGDYYGNVLTRYNILVLVLSYVVIFFSRLIKFDVFDKKLLIVLIPLFYLAVAKLVVTENTPFLYFQF